MLPKIIAHFIQELVTNEEVGIKIQAAIGKYDELLTMVKKRKLRGFGNVSRSSGLAKTILPWFLRHLFVRFAWKIPSS